MSDASRDGSFVTTLLAVSSVDGVTPVTLYANPTTHRLLVDIAAGMSNPMTTGGDIIYGGAAGTPTRLANGTAGQVLTSQGTTLAPIWSSAGAGNVTKVGTPVNDQIGVWTGDGTIEGTANFTQSSTGNVAISGSADTVLTVSHTGTGSNVAKFTANEGGGFGYSVVTIENTNSGGRAELALDTDDGPYAGFLTMAGTTTTNSARQMDLGTRVSGDISFWTNNTERLTLDAGGTSLAPTFTDTLALGTSSLMWADLYLASGGVINWDNGNVLLTHAAGRLTLSGGDLLVTAAENPLVARNTTDSASVEVLSVEGDRATPAANDEIYQSFRLSDSAGTQTAFARVVVTATNVTDTTEAADLKFQTMAAGTLASRAVLNSTALRPNANDGIALGSATVSFSDLFLASGGVINWNNGNMSLAQSAGVLTISDLSTGATGPVLEIFQDSSSPAASDIIGELQFYGRDSAANKQLYTAIRTVVTDPTSTSEDSQLTFRVTTAGTTATELILDGAGLVPFTSDGLALGSATNQYSDLFLAEGAVINWDNGDATLTQTGNDLTLAGASLTARTTKRTGTTTSSATPTINTDNVDYYSITAQAVDITSMTTNLSGTPTTAQQLRIDITGTAARAITWGASFANGPVALPTTTVTTTRLYVMLEYDGTIWRCMASGSTV